MAQKARISLSGTDPKKVDNVCQQIKLISERTGATKQEKPDTLKTGDAAIVKIRPTKPLVIEPAKNFPQLGRFAIRDMGQTVAAGMCIDVEK